MHSNSLMFFVCRMFGVDVVVDSVTSNQTVVYIAAAGKHVPANVMGNGGDAYAFQVIVPNK